MAYKRQLFDGSNTTEIKSIDSFLNESLLGVPIAPTSNPLHIYATVAYLYRCIDVRANALLAMPWSIYRGDTELVRHDVDEWPKELAAYQAIDFCHLVLAYRGLSALGLSTLAVFGHEQFEIVYKLDFYADHSTAEIAETLAALELIRWHEEGHKGDAPKE